MGSRIDDDKRAAILADIQAGKLSRNKIAKAHGVSVGSVTNIAKQAGLTTAFDRSATKTATRAREVDLAAARAELKADLITDAQELRARARSPYTYYERGPDGPELVTLPLPPLRETREAYTALGIALDKHLKLDQHDQADNATAARSLIGDLAAGLQAAYTAMGDEGAGDAPRSPAPAEP